VSTDLDLGKLSHAEKDALILSLVAQLQAALARIGELEKQVAELQRPPKTPDNSSMPPSQGQKPNTAEQGKRNGPRSGSVGRKGGGRELIADPDETVVARAARCQYCQSALADADQKLDARYDKIDLPRVRPVVTRVERYAGCCQCCGRTTLAALPEGLEPGTPFSINIVALAMYLRFVHAVSYQRLSRLLLDLYALRISEGALDAAFRRSAARFDADVAAILARLRRARVIGSDETSVRVGGVTRWNWVFPLEPVVPARTAMW
jgi:transposase